MEPCQTQVFFKEIYGLLELISNQQLVLKEEAITRVTELVKRWQEIECPMGRCVAPCPYAKPNVYWIESLGYADLYDLIFHLDPAEKIRKIRGQPLEHFPLMLIDSVRVARN